MKAVAKTKEAAPVTRTSEGLRDALFEELDMLRKGDSTPQRAGAVSKLATTVIDAARLDIEFVRFAKASGKNKPQPLKLGRAA
jgi:hypothetical protein